MTARYRGTLLAFIGARQSGLAQSNVENQLLLETIIRILELRRAGRPISSLVQEFRVARSTIPRVLDAREEIELSIRCGEMLERGVNPYVVADLRRVAFNGLRKHPASQLGLPTSTRNLPPN